MRLAVLVLAMMALSGCHSEQPKMSDEQLSDLRKMGIKDECLRKAKWEGAEVITEDCVERSAPAHWRGLWRDDFESPLFCHAPARECTNGPQPGKKIWLRLEPRPVALRKIVPGGLYAIEFIGRRSVHGTPAIANGFAQDIVVDRLISLKQVEPSPK